MRLFTSLLIFVFHFSTVANCQNYVTLYEECNYAGRSHILEAGNYRGYQMRISNDKLSGMRIPYGFKITIYEHDGFSGRSQTFSDDNPCLPLEWNDMASSIVVEIIMTNGQPVSPNDFVTFYTDAYHKGASQSLRPGSYTGAQLNNLKYNISSFTISGNLRVKLFPNNEILTGYSETFDQSQSYLISNLNDKVGSLIIEYKPQTQNNNYNNNNYVTLYTECNFNGNGIRLMPGYYDGNKLGLFKFNTSSVQIPNGLQIKAFASENLYGQSVLLTDINQCFDFNLKNRIGSIVVEERANTSNPNNNSGNTNEQVIIYTDGNYRGQSAILLPGTYPTMANAGGFPNKALSSLQVPAGYTVILYENENFGGKSYTITSSRTGFSFTNWNDRASSIKVFRN